MKDKYKKNEDRVLKVIFRVLLVFLFFNIFFFKIVTVSGDSMSPTLEEGRFYVATHFNETYERGDIVIIKTEKRLPLTKRIIALEGDHIKLGNDGVFVNGVKLDEPYLAEFEFPSFYTEPIELTVPDGKIYVLGDNRPISLDSRKFGTIHADNILGKVRYKISLEGLRLLR
ncbi:signal peptidase I [Fusibacter tunisiensis]|uniref:Signal peptidase I n=1 Tax=Fusibacter tunisiensis TaxID=1008308 RepID=A0ABS2MTA3_9FIRM|nr:signal peptidase I [Fusibacter tunisiensis]MBM7562620.1 signal peptidase I [Fusibacter tunisiensis]